MPKNSTTTEILPVGIETAGVRMSLEIFRAIDYGDVDEFYRYELVRGVLVVTVARSFSDRAANEVLGHRLREFLDNHPQGPCIDATVYSQEVTTRRDTVRVADRVIWLNLGRTPDPEQDIPAIVVDFVCAGRRHWMDDYEVRRREYLNCSVSEYWLIDRFETRMSVYRRGRRAVIFEPGDRFETPLLPGFDVPLNEMMADARHLSAAQRAKKAIHR
jgi:Uma2 family endonuclease